MKPYRPSNGTEGMWFEEQFCMQCIHCDPDPTGVKQCEKLCNAYCFDIGDKEYPKEWVYDTLGHPTCSAHVNWDWGEDGDPDDPDNPKVPSPPSDPSQYNIFPLYPNEKDFEPKTYEAKNISTGSSGRGHGIV